MPAAARLRTRAEQHALEVNDNVNAHVDTHATLTHIL